MKRKIPMSNEQSKAISSIRVVASLMIVLCHILQGMDNELAWWFNIGVQVFLCMSGFLLAHSVYSNWREYLWRRIKRLAYPYWILLTVIIPIYFLVGVKITWNQVIIYSLGMEGVVGEKIPGLEHLWFITTIIICYILLISMDKLKKVIIKNREIRFWFSLGLVCICIQLISTVTGIGINNGAWIATFFIGYFLSARYEYTIPNKLIYLAAPIIGITTGIRVYFSYLQEIKVEFLQKIFNILFIPWSKVLLGCFIFMVLYNIFSKFYLDRKLNRGVKWLDNISYEMYLVHQVIILGPLSLLKLTSKLWINLIIILILVILLSHLLHLSSGWISKKLLSNQDSLKAK